MSDNNKSKRGTHARTALYSTALATGGALLLGSGAQAQDEAATVPNGYSPLSEIDGVARVEMQADGSAQLVMADGQTVLIAAQDVSVVDGVVYLSDAAIQANALGGTAIVGAGAGATGGGGGGAAALGLLGGAGLIGAAAGGGGGGGSSTPSTPPNTNPPVFTSPAAASVDENSTGTVYTATATDADGNTVRFSITGGADASLFSINATSGVVTFNAPPDFEAPGDGGGDNVYDITIRATDGTNTTDQAVTITVADVDEAPTVTSAQAVSVDENVTGTVYTAQASDPETATLTYSLTGDDAALFTIDAATGAVSFVASPDHENPGDADGDNVYEITVNASDGSQTATQAVSITVDPVNEAAPVFSSGTTAAFDENATGTVYTATAADADNDTVTYSLGSAGDSALFQIDSASGALTFIAAPDFENPGDGNGDNVYSVEIIASDGSLDSSRTVDVTIADVNEAPTITSGASVSIAENTAGTIYTATASDPESGAVTYSLSGADAALFAINAVTGEVSFLAPPDHETPLDSDGDNVYAITVNASDGTHVDSQAVAVTVTNTNEFAPVITSSSTDSVDEDSTGSFYTATATDGDGDTLSWSIAGTGDGALFSIDAATGALSFITPPDFENPADADNDNVYELTLQVSDGTTTTTQTLSVTVNNVNAAPVITSSASASFDENDTGTAYTITSTDGDGDSIVYSIAGADAALFSVNAVTGAVSFLVSPDYESPADADGDNVYSIQVVASDGTSSTSQDVDISVANQNDVAPVITSGSSVSVAEGVSGTVYTAVASDAEGDTISYSLTGTDAALFQIDSASGEVSFITAPDFEAPADAGGDNVYDITVNASDGSLTDQQAVTVTVTDVDEGNAPVIDSGSSQTVSENQTSAYVARATDPQGDAITWSLSGTDAALFSIDADTGEVSFLTAPDAEAAADANGDGDYEFTVTASDGSASSSQSVTVTVADVVNEITDVPGDDTTEIQMVSGGDYTGTLELSGDRDWVAVTLEAGQRYQFDVAGSGGAGVELEDTYVRLYDSSGTLIAENDDITLGVNTDSRLGYTATTSGTYYVSVGAWEGGTAPHPTGQYTLQVRHTDPLSAWNYQEIGDYLNANGFGGLQWDRTAGDTITVDITALTADGQMLARAALQLWEDITGINFTEVSINGEITFDDDESGAFAGPDETAGGFITAASVNVSTDWLTTYGTNLDGYSFQTYIHEIGHAIGLGHGGPYDGSAEYAIDAIYLNDSWQASVMSYFSQNENTFITADFGYVIGPQVADIIAVTDMYGGSTSTRGGDTVYGYNSTAGNTIFDATAFTNAVSFTVFDTGGTDTFDYSGSAADQVFDLREQAYSSLMGRDGNIGIARGTVIENAIGGSGEDVFVGNDANNLLTGGAGADRFYASGGTDVFNGGTGNDTAVFSGASTDYTLSTNGSGNTVVTDNRAGAPDGVVELISVESIVYDGGISNPEYFGDPDFAGREGLDPDNLPELAHDGEGGHDDGGKHPVMDGHGDEDDGLFDRHPYPHLSDDDLALLRVLTHEDGNSVGIVTLPGWNMQGARIDDWSAHTLDVDAVGQMMAATGKDKSVFETLTDDEADAGLTIQTGLAGAALNASGIGLAALPDLGETDAPVVLQDAADGWV